VADWRWEPVTDDLLDGLPPAALAAVRQVADAPGDAFGPGQYALRVELRPEPGHM